MKCVSCSGAVTKGKVCRECGSLYCDMEKCETCSMCQGATAPIEVRMENLLGTNVDWLSVNGLNEIGVVGSSPPSGIVRISEVASKSAAKATFEMILFESKKASMDFALRVSPILKEQYTAHDRKAPPEQSAYLLLQNEKGSRRFLLINMGALKPQAQKFFFEFVPRAFLEADLVRQEEEREIILAAGKILLGYNKKFGLPSSYASEPVRSLIQFFTMNEKYGFAEHRAFASAISPENVASAREFFEHKLEVSYSGIKWGDIDFFTEALELLAKHAQMLATVEVTKPWDSLHSPIEKKYESLYKDSVEKSKSHPDLIRALAKLRATLADRALPESYGSYIKVLMDAIVEAVDELAPTYVWFDDSIIHVGGLFYSASVTNANPRVEGFGDRDSFLELLLDVFGRKDVYQSIPIAAGTIAFQLYQAKLLYYFSESDFRKAIALAVELATRVEKEVPRMRNIDRSYPIRLGDGIDPLLVLRKIARLNGFAKEELEMENLAWRLIRTHHLYPLEANTLWLDWLDRLEPKALNQLHRVIERVRTGKKEPLAPYLLMTRNLTRALFEPESIEALANQSEIEALRIADPVPTMGVGRDFSNMGYQIDMAVRSTHASEVMLHFISLFKHLLLANRDSNEAYQHLRQAHLEASAMLVDIQEHDTPVKPALRTEIIYRLSLGETETVKKLLLRITGIGPAGTDTGFEVLLKEWLLTEPGEFRRLVLLSHVQYEGLDPWSRLATSLMRQMVFSDLQSTLVNARAVVLVEGPTDTAVMRRVAKLLVPDEKIEFLDTGGWTTALTVAGGAFVAEFVKLGGSKVYCLFDGDTLRKDKNAKTRQSLEEKFGLTRDSFATLAGNTIEDYLLVPAAIKRAYPSIPLNEDQIGQFLANRSGKKNKKYVLNDLLSSNGIGGYNPEAAARIAGSLKLSEIGQDLVMIVRQWASSKRN